MLSHSGPVARTAGSRCPVQESGHIRARAMPGHQSGVGNNGRLVHSERGGMGGGEGRRVFVAAQAVTMPKI